MNMIEIKNKVKKEKPLIHCITNHITINDCANMILAVGGKPIMAEHQSEVAKITKSAKSLLINLGNISDERIIGMKIGGQSALENGVPLILDPVGVGCSDFRLALGKELIKTFSPQVVKGNMSEIKRLMGYDDSEIKGVDVSEEDEIREGNLRESIQIGKDFARDNRCIVAITGEYDIVSNGNRTVIIKNGDSMMAEVTGTGCMSGAIISTWFNSNDPLNSVVSSLGAFGISGEIAKENAKGIGSYKTALFDAIYLLDEEQIKKRLRIVEVNE